MLGSGTKTDPFIPESWEDFKTAVSKKENYVSLPPNTVYNMNEICPTGVTQTVRVLCRELRGNNSMVQFAYINKVPILTFCTSYSGSQYIYDFHVVNSYVESTTGSDVTGISFDNQYNNEYIYFYNCWFSGVVYNASFLNSYSGKAYFKYCSFNFNLANSNIKIRTNSSLYIEDSNINIIGVVRDLGIDLSYLTRCTVTSYLDTVTKKQGVVTTKGNTNYAITLYSCTLNKYDFCTPNLLGTLSGTDNLWNITKAPPRGGYSMSVITCTEEQINDMEYLVSVGFPVGSG